MTEFAKYVKEKGLNLRVLAQQMKISRQRLYNYGVDYTPTSRTIKKIATAMTELGVETAPSDIVPLFYGK